jgi:hypothetical protein
MKIRFGHVSNSSSSSFILALDELPESAEDMLEMLFGSKENPDRLVHVYDETATAMTIAKTAYGDICDYMEDNSPLDLDGITELLSNRYHVYISPYSYNPTPRQDLARWYGVDLDALMEWYQVEVDTSNERREAQNRVEAYLKANNAEYKSGKPEEVKAHNERRLEFMKHDKKYKELDDAEKKAWKGAYEECDAAREKAARADAKAFMKANEGRIFVRVKYDDGYSLGAVMEHGDVFDTISHVRISHH